MPASVENNRLRTFKNKGKDAEELRKRRTDHTVELRKAKKEDQMLKRRNVSLLSSVSPLKENNRQITTAQLSMSEVKEIILSISPQTDQQLLSAVQSVRRMLSKEQNPPIEIVIKSGLVPKIVELLARTTNPEIQFEAAWALTNIASGTSEQTKIVVESGAVSVFVQLLSSQYPNVCEQAVWALGNIAGDGPQFRDFVLNQGIVGPLIALISPATPHSFLRNLTWTLSNLCRNKSPPPPQAAISMMLPPLGILLHHEDKDVVADACWAVSYLTDGSNEKIEVVLQNSDILPRLIELLGTSEIKVVTPALRAVGNIVTGTDQQTQKFVDAGGLKHFEKLFCHSKNTIVKEASWAVSNVAAGNQIQIQSIIDHKLLPYVVNTLAKGDFKSQKEAIWIVTNFTSGGSPDQVGEFLNNGLLPPLCDLLAVKEAKVVLVVLDAINNILLKAEEVSATDAVCRIIEESGGLDKIEYLQEHVNEQVYKAALELVERFFSAEEESIDEMAPDVNCSTGEFQFGAPTANAPTFQL